MKNKNYLILGAVIIGIILIGLGGFDYMNQGQKDKNTMITDELNTDQTIEEVNTLAEYNERYVEYSNNALTDNSGSQRVLFFYANWCPICRPVDAELKANFNQIPENLRIIRVNFNDADTNEEEKALASKYGITYQHTFVQIDQGGKEVTKWNGGGLEEILDNIK